MHDDQQQGREQGQAEARHVVGRRNEEAAAVEEGHVEEAQALARRRQGGEHAEIPEQHEEQQRDVAHELDVEAGQAREQPVARQPQQPHGEADHRRHRDRGDRDQQRVDDAGPQQGQDRVGRLVAGEVERHLDAGIAPQEAEARRDARLHHVVRGVLHEEPDDRDHRHGRQPPATARPAPCGRAGTSSSPLPRHGRTIAQADFRRLDRGTPSRSAGAVSCASPGDQPGEFPHFPQFPLAVSSEAAERTPKVGRGNAEGFPGRVSAGGFRPFRTSSIFSAERALQAQCVAANE